MSEKINLSEYTEFITKKTCELLAVDSPTGYTKEAAKWVFDEFAALGFTGHITTKGGILICLGGASRDNALLLEAHADTLGAIVQSVKSNGRLLLSPLGGMNPNNAETENVKIITKFNGEYEGTLQLNNASLHVNGSYNDTKRTWNDVEVVIDENTASAEDTKKLGIDAGDIICFEPNTRVTKSGYIKSRFLDDKLSVGILLGYAKYLKDHNITPQRTVYVHVTVYEEVGHGGCASVPDGVTEAI